MARKRQSGVKRTASGRRSRAAEAYQENADAIATRMRLFGLSEQDARDQKASTFIGRLQLMRIIDQHQYDAALEFLRIEDAYHRAISAPDGLKSTGTSGGNGSDTEAYAAWCRRCIAKHDAAESAVLAEQCLHQHRGSNFFAALDYLVRRDEPHWHLVGDCRLALNVLAHHFGIVSTVKTATAA
jgi:hypothetical protein